MWFFLALLAVLFLTLLLFGMVSTSAPLVDMNSPLNMALFRAPQQRYTDQIVNLWIEKPWRQDGGRIPCRIEYARDHPRERIILYSHGNGENLLTCVPFLRQAAEALEYDMVTWDYSGYGLNPSDEYERSADGVNASLQAIYQYLQDVEHYPPDRIVVWGYSLGSGPTLALAKDQEVAGVILLAAFTSIKDVIGDLTSPKVADWFEERWDNQNAMRDIKCPVLIMHGDSDSLVRVHHAQKLKRVSAHATLQVLHQTTHSSFNWLETLGHVRNWLSKSVVHGKNV